MKEKVLIIFTALALGLTITTIAFYLVKTTKNLPKEIKENITTIKSVKTTPKDNDDTLQITEPKDESITDKRTVQIKGITKPNNTVILSSANDDVVVNANANGDFSSSLSIDSGVNKVTVRSVSADGNESVKNIFITFTQEEF